MMDSPVAEKIKDKGLLLSEFEAMTNNIYETLEQYLSDPKMLDYCCDAVQISPLFYWQHGNRRVQERMDFIEQLSEELSQMNRVDVIFPGLVFFDPDYLKRVANGVVLIDQYLLTKEDFRRLNIKSRYTDCLMGKKYSIFTKERNIPDKEALEHYYDTPVIKGDVVEALLGFEIIPEKLIPLPVSPYESISELLVVDKLDDYFTLGMESKKHAREKYAVYGPKSDNPEFEMSFASDFKETLQD